MIKIILVFYLCIKLLLGIAYKYNYKGLADTVIHWLMLQDLENYLRVEAVNNVILEYLIIIILLILC